MHGKGFISKNRGEGGLNHSDEGYLSAADIEGHFADIVVDDDAEADALNLVVNFNSLGASEVELKEFPLGEF